jgi:hypothetical protein
MEQTLGEILRKADARRAAEAAAHSNREASEKTALESKNRQLVVQYLADLQSWIT